MATMICGICGECSPANEQHVCPSPTLFLTQEKREFRLGVYASVVVELQQSGEDAWVGEVVIGISRGERGGREEAVVARVTGSTREKVQQSIRTALTQIGHAFIQAAEKG